MKPTRAIKMLIACLLLFVCGRPMAQEVASLHLTAGEGDLMELDFRLGDCTVRTVGDRYAKVEAEGMIAMASKEGLPALPMLTCMVSLPRGSKMSVVKMDVGDERRVHLGRGRLLMPWQGADVKSDQQPTEVLPSEEAYDGRQVWSGGEMIEVEDLGTMGEEQLVRVWVRPAVYQVADEVVGLATEVHATLKVERKAKKQSMTAAGDRYLVVSRPEFRQGLQPFVRWKRQEGYRVKELYVDTSQCDSVRAKMATEWQGDEAEWPRYVLLVGDVRKLQAFTATTAPLGLLPTITDLYYVEHTGDYLPDAIVGRWPVNDTAELRAVVEKTLRYEQGLALDTHWLRRAMLVAGYERYNPAPITTNGQVNYVGRELKRSHPEMDTLCWRNPASELQRDSILNALSQGATLLNYTAHCTTSGWTSPAVQFRSIDTLPSPQPLLYVNNCCESNHFGGTCFGEQLLRKPQGGAIGVIGATNSTLWDEDYYWSVGPKLPFTVEPTYDSLRPGAFDRWIGRKREVTTQGELMVAGNLAVMALGSPYDKFYWEIYCLLGDPSLMPYVGVPQVIDLAVENAPSVGATQLTLRGTAGARVGVVQADSLIGSGIIAADGRLTLSLLRSLDTNEVLLTATAYGRWPKVDTVRPTATMRAAGLCDVQFADSVLGFTLTNYGRQTLRGLTVGLLQDSTDFGGGAEMSTTPVAIDSLRAGESVVRWMVCRLAVVGQEPVWRGQLVVADTGHLCLLNVEQPLAIAYPQMTLSLHRADSSATSSLEEGQDYLLHTSVSGAYDSLQVVSVVLPSSTQTVGRHEWSPIAIPQGTQHLGVEATLQWGRWQQRQAGYVATGSVKDGFEQGFACYPWQQGGTQPWVVDSNESHGGHFSVRSGAIGSRQTSDMTIEIQVMQAGTLGFWAKVSCEEIYDKLVFSLDGVSLWQTWGERGWERYSTSVSAGKHTLRWRYGKDESGSEGADCVWIDDIELPLTLWDSTYGCGGASHEGIESVEREEGRVVYPNPAKESVSVVVGDASAEGVLTLTDVYGRLWLSRRIGHTPVEHIDLSGLGSGIYLLRVDVGSRSEVYRLIVR